VKPEVLVVEDERTISAPLAEHLHRERFETSVATTVEDAKVRRVAPPDLTRPNERRGRG